MKRDEIALIVHDTILNFPQNIEKPLVEFLTKRRFSKYLDLLEANKHVDKTPCMVVSTKGGDIIYVCKQTVVDMVSGFDKKMTKMFIEAVTLHELFHIWNNIEVDTVQDLIFSEAMVDQEMRKFYPDHSNLLTKFYKHVNRC